ncbi:sn-glycerol-3-phosphate ABC transporter ATP-binding protein UgpC [Olsenella sp. DSM 107455]|uniref:Sn-glycerol-3-phosphate ABC transporter ATP-binding protein UgpC n=1 Tax=Thermophilibacter gallinarum TaxID=2779357 RepID=A0ABR9QUV1_9ACTN|nr:sn-glycerol-3-phosphate ABC transporter ATP-binding protein UgpC [Thermophilibacter gallinarum]MBE5024847.1 sn-glycerol-3-phosphate ABC transporter ATP-binding protein UgpC [Thermophilibacter gallinarum]
MASISLRNIEKTYDNKVTVIKDLNLEIADKEFIVLVGPSGCGKSTTLRMIAGLESITAGDLFIGDKRMNDVAPKDRDIAMVFQNYALYPHMTVYRNMAYALELRRVPKAEIRAKVEEVAKVLELTKFLDRKPKELSGGQRQRVALGRAMVRDPAVFLLDEPLSNLDAKLRTEMRAQISALHRRLETTFVYVTHDQTEAMTMGDRIVVMRDGVIHQVDTPQNLFDRPDNIFVAGFIGSPQMNFIDATVERAEGGYELVGVLGRLPIANERLADYVGKQVVVGVRPEDIMEASECPDAPAAAVTEASVDLSELMGSEVYVYFTAAERRIIARISSRLDIRAGDTVRLVPDLSALHVFDMETERAICHGLDA